MLHHPTLDQLEQLRFGEASSPRPIERLSFMERLGLLLDRETSDRASRALQSRLRRARLHQAACMEDLDYRADWTGARC